jgi:D-alanyl-D-alanine carboxypeptidase (penicillin-binding protein 5/6)
MRQLTAVSRFRTLVATGVLAALAFTAVALAQPVSSSHTEDVPPALAVPAVNARSYIVFDAQDDTLLAEKNSSTPYPIASLTKMMTALVVVERAKGDQVVTVSKNAARPDLADEEFKMEAGEKLTVDDLLGAMLVRSSNGAAVALAEEVGGTEADFIAMMNDRAHRLKLNNSTFTSVNGLEDAGNASSAGDLLLLTRTALKDRRIEHFTQALTFDLTRSDGTTIKLHNRNRLLKTYEGVDGVKTGHTDLAGYCLITHYADEDGSDLYTIVLGTLGEDARDRETAKLIDWARLLRPQVTIAEAGTPIGSAPIAFSDSKVGLYLSDNVKAHVRIGSTLHERITVPRLIKAGTRAGDEIGTYEVLVGKDVVAKTGIYIDKDVHHRSWQGKMRLIAGQWRRAGREGWHEMQSTGRRIKRYWGI